MLTFNIALLAERTGVRGIAFGILAKQGRANMDDRADYFRYLAQAQEALRCVYEKSIPSIEIDCHFPPELLIPILLIEVDHCAIFGLGNFLEKSHVTNSILCDEYLVSIY